MTKLEGELDVANARIADIEEQAKDLLAANAAKAASEKAAEVLKALETLSGTLPTINGVCIFGGYVRGIEAASYTESSTAADAISGFRGKILTKDSSEAHVYTNIENAVATAIDSIYTVQPVPLGSPRPIRVVDECRHRRRFSKSHGQRSRETTAQRLLTIAVTDPVTTFAGSVSGLAGTFSCTDACIEAPTRNTNGSVNDWRQPRNLDVCPNQSERYD